MLLTWGKLHLDKVAVELALVQDRARRRAKAVRGDRADRVSHAAQRLVEGGLRERLRRLRPLGQDVLRAARGGLRLGEDRHRLSRERHRVGLAHLHPLSRDIPGATFQIELIPRRVPKLARANEGQGEELEPIDQGRRAVIALDLPQKRTEAPLVGDGGNGVVLRRFSWHREGSASGPSRFSTA